MGRNEWAGLVLKIVYGFPRVRIIFMKWEAAKNFVLPVWFATAMLISGCAEFDLVSPSPEVKAFFVAGQEANFLGTVCTSSGYVDLSAFLI
jgi:hypothetical protein